MRIIICVKKCQDWFSLPYSDHWHGDHLPMGRLWNWLKMSNNWPRWGLGEAKLCGKNDGSWREINRERARNWTHSYPCSVQLSTTFNLAIHKQWCEVNNNYVIRQCLLSFLAKQLKAKQTKTDTEANSFTSSENVPWVCPDEHPKLHWFPIPGRWRSTSLLSACDPMQHPHWQ